jgi:diguanylate cyclase (GGDEF)-like protein
MRIVLVDPSRAVQQAMMRLIGDGGHDVVAFADGREALAYVAEDSNVRTVITSTQPLNISGIELCAAVHRLGGERRALHVMLMSSTDDYHLAIAALDAGADDFIHKPPIPDELRARLRLADRVTLMKQQLIQYATTDMLTGLLNRRAFFDRAVELCDMARAGQKLSAILFDVDHFKEINDIHGHEAGDRVLATVGAHVKLDGVTGRLGGEEFGVLTPGEAEDACEHARDLQRAICALRFDQAGRAFSITCSFGVAEWEMDDSVDHLLRRADLAMYEAKRSGRNRIVLADTYALTPAHDEWRGAARVGLRSSLKSSA